MKNKIKSKNSNLIIVAVVVVAAILVGVQTGLVSLPQQNTANSNTPFGNNPSATSGEYTGFTGDIAMQVAHYDAQAITTTRTEATNVATSWYVMEGGSYSNVGSGDGATFELKPEHLGYVYAQVEAKSGQNYYLAVDITQDKESRIVDYNYFDIDVDGTLEHVFTVWCGNLKDLAGGETNKDCFVNFRWDTYEKPGFVAGAPADITGVGTTSGTVKYVEWYSNFTNTNRVWLLYQVEIKVNSTSTTKWSIDWVNVPGLGNIAGSKFVDSSDGTNTIYKYTLSKTLDVAHRITYGTNEVNKQEYEMKLKLYLSGGDQLGFTITLSGLDTTEKVETITDTVGIAA